MAQRLLNKVAVVTGASGRLGRAVVQKFVAEGAKVVVFARNSGRLDELAAFAPARIAVVPGDVTRPGDLELLRETMLRRMGGIDILVPAAEQFRAAGLDECTPESVDGLFAVNFQGVLQTIRTLGRHLNSPASIVLVTTSLSDQSRAGSAAFAASKSALFSLAQTLAVELSPRRVRVNCVAPMRDEPHGPAITSKGSAVLPVVDAAQAVLFLASDESAGITGQQIVVDPPA
ncbi:MAG TPA: SDR family oxidoreductase [Planctomycetaceae bacterium]|nr:SDR family oxidoreductase [Planctomycetaceae bacterium]